MIYRHNDNVGFNNYIILMINQDNIFGYTIYYLLIDSNSQKDLSTPKYL